KPKDLAIKLAALDLEPAVIDHLILLRPEDDLTLSGKSKQLWQDAERRGRHARLEPVTLDAFATLYALPRLIAGLTEALPAGGPPGGSPMSMQTPTRPVVVYPDSDGQPIAENTKQYRYIVTIKGNLDGLFRHDPNVFVAGDHFWYPVEGEPGIRVAPDVMAVF